MKQTSIIAALLTFFSLLLVLGAAVVFLFQGRQELQAHVADLQGDLESQNQAIAEFQTTAAAREMSFSTSEALLATSDALLATREVELAEYRAALGDLQATRDAEVQAQEEQAPFVEIVRPAEGEVVDDDAPLEVLIVAGHTQGIINLRLEVADRAITFQDNGEPFRVFTHRVLSLTPGQLTITATVTAVNTFESSDVVTVTVREPGAPADAGNDTSLLRFVPVALGPR